ncbi:30S ribosomal protein S6 [bacterium]|nr:30S ribosomal protein S6 [bacterium]
MRDYETTILLDSSLSDEEYKKKLGQFEELFGSEAQLEDMGVRQLAYPIKRARDAHYLRYFHKADNAQLEVINARLRIDEPVMRYLVIKADE